MRQPLQTLLLVWGFRAYWIGGNCLDLTVCTAVNLWVEEPLAEAEVVFEAAEGFQSFFFSL